jgi:hypothetical protein
MKKVALIMMLVVFAFAYATQASSPTDPTDNCKVVASSMASTGIQALPDAFQDQLAVILSDKTTSNHEKALLAVALLKSYEGVDRGDAFVTATEQSLVTSTEKKCPPLLGDDGPWGPCCKDGWYYNCEDAGSGTPSK